MGDISRHRDIYLFTRDTVPAQVLDGVRISRGDLTYLELGNYLTDVSQFRDPVTFIFAKRRIWNDKIIPQTSDALVAARVIAGLVAVAAPVATHYLKDLTSGTAADVVEGAGIGVGALAGLLALLPAGLVADLAGADTWIDALLGMPLERLPPATTEQARRKQDGRHYGHLGQFFRQAIEGTTHALFADDVAKRPKGQWGRVDPIPVNRVSEVFEEFFTQYYPHEHTDQPPYVWDASKRPAAKLYQPSRRQHSLGDGEVGVMNAVDQHYIGYLADELGRIEQEWRGLTRDDLAGRQRLLVRTGKLLHGVEDWFFHSNVVELIELRGFRPEQLAGESDEAFLARFVEDVAKRRPEYVAVSDPKEKRRLKRKLFRRLRYPAYDAGTKEASAGRLSTSRDSTPSLRHAYPAFPSSQDTAHTLLHALENLEHKAAGSPGQLPSWVTGALNRHGLSIPSALAGVATPLVMASAEERLREWVPLVLTLLSESERQRLVANVAPQHWPLAAGVAAPKRTTTKTEIGLQLERHVAALTPHQTQGGPTENNYEQFVRYLVEGDHLNRAGQAALVAAFEIDRLAEALPTSAPGCGGFLMQFALELQEQLDRGDAETEKLNAKDDAVLGRASDNGSFSEIVGSHSLMSKDTLTSVPFFDDAAVLGSLASSSVFTILLQQIATPRADRRLDWEQVLHHLIRFPPRNGGWERRALALYTANGRTIPTFADLPELAALAERALRPVGPVPAATTGASRRSKREDLEERYRRLEVELSTYRYP
jgi:hypothetical protein